MINLELATFGPVAALGLRMALVAGFVMLVAVIAERAGPFFGAMIASLPLSAGPIYIMLAFDHDAEWIKQAMLGSVAICGATPVFIIVYCVLARSRGAFASISVALLAWLGVALIVQAHVWALSQALLFVLPMNVIAVFVGQRFTHGVRPAAFERRWWDLLIRALLCAVLSGFVIGISNVVPPQISGLLALTPILFISLAIVLHARVGGAATAALMAHSLSGLIGMVIGLSVAQVSIARLGVWPALGVGLVIAITWNLLLITTRNSLLQRGSAMRQHQPGD